MLCLNIIIFNKYIQSLGWWRLNYTTYAFNIGVTRILTFKILLTGRFSKNCQKSPRILLNAWYQYRCFLTSTQDYYTRLMRLKHILLTSVSGLISVSCAQGVTWGCWSDWDFSMFSVSSLSLRQWGPFCYWIMCSPITPRRPTMFKLHSCWFILRVFLDWVLIINVLF